jgi:UDP-N-acetylglucosamine transferase subunit ALG13
MILVLLGTNPYPFERLASEMDRLAKAHNLDVFVQSGSTKYPFKYCEAVSFMPYAEIRRKISQCEMLIVQGGAGSIADGLSASQPMVVIPRDPKHGESQDCQADLVRRLEALGCVIGVYAIQDLWEKMNQAKQFHPVRPPANRIPNVIKNYLESLSR